MFPEQLLLHYVMVVTKANEFTIGSIQGSTLKISSGRHTGVENAFVALRAEWSCLQNVTFPEVLHLNMGGNNNKDGGIDRSAVFEETCVKER